MPSARMRAQRTAGRLRALAGCGRVLTLAGAGIVLVVLLATLILPYLDQQRRIATEVPQPPPLKSVSLVEIPGAQQACADEIGLLPGRQVAEMRIGTYGRAPAPLLFSLSAPGYAQTTAVPATYVNNGLLDVPFNGPPKVLEGSVCVTNQGRTPVALYAAAETGKSRSTTTVHERLWPANFDLAFYAAKPRSLLADAGTIMRRLRLFHAHLGLGLLWLLAILFAIGVPLGAIAALASADTARR